MLKKLGIGLVVLVVLFVIIGMLGSSGSDTTTTETAAPAASSEAPIQGPPVPEEMKDGHVHAPLAAGTVTQIDGGGGEIHKLTVLEIADPATPGNTYAIPSAGNRFWGIKLEAENIGTDALNLGEWKLRGSDDYEYDKTYMSSIEPQLEGYKNLTPGGKTAGWVVFEMPEGVTAKWLRYDPNIISEEDLYFEAA